MLAKKEKCENITQAGDSNSLRQNLGSTDKVTIKNDFIVNIQTSFNGFYFKLSMNSEGWSETSNSEREQQFASES